MRKHCPNPRALEDQHKSQPRASLPHTLLLTPSPPQSTRALHTTDMACYDLCRPCGPTPLANSCNEPCVRQCEDSRVVIQPSTVVVTLPGPILSSFPQNTAVGSSSSAAVGNVLSSQGVPISSGGFGYGFGGLGCFSGARGCYPC
ncbi:feather keratin 1-like [Gymnogyps californianus]|uniref:feather keratin 1-like n=1 Tax=Gymnogyps californianus TaxID=33616 RepID=UPI0021C99A4C|nr:feather keratin 1-like [Gymnogyps californianus]